MLKNNYCFASSENAFFMQNNNFKVIIKLDVLWKRSVLENKFLFSGVVQAPLMQVSDLLEELSHDSVTLKML